MYRRWGKRAFDLVAAAVALIALSPLLAVTALAIKLTDRGPALYISARIGRGEDVFNILKFRSMPVGTPTVASSDAATVTVTPIGRIIRRTNIDELPQLVNVVRGDMSLVGPRPALPSQRNLNALRRRNGVTRLRPGLTGLAQIKAYDNMSDEEKADWDTEYDRELSLPSDLAIIGKTITYLLKPPPTY